MKVTLRALSSITPYEKNPRLNEAAVDKVAKSIEQYGWRQPIVVDEHGVIIVGHTRWKAATQLGLAKVPVHVATGLTEQQVREYRLADNKTHEFAEWDIELLTQETLELEEQGSDLSWLEFDVELPEVVDEGKADADAVPDIPKNADTNEGDIWKLGEHRLMCGSSLEAANWAKLLGKTKAHLLLTDPPYGIDYEGKTADKLKVANDDKRYEASREFLAECFKHCFAYMLNGATFYIWHADSEGYWVRGALLDNGHHVKQTLIWSKSAITLGRQDYQWQHEPCLYGWKDGGSHRWFSDRSQTTILRFDKPAASRDHPTMKPTELMVYQLNNSTMAEDVVIDPFLGSGSTLIACQRTGRRCFGFELSPQYCDVIVKRWENYTGLKAERIPVK